MTGPMLFDIGGPSGPMDSDGMPATTAANTASGGGQTQSLYRKYRPQSFDAEELVGQEHVVRTLRNAVALGRVAHAYLFCGPRGTGKTTTARLLAKAVNCLDPDPQQRPCNRCANCVAISTGATTDVVEIDAASNRGIDDIRDLRERVKYAPTQLKTKFYIIDEAHQITGAAANAFLKTLEEPPAHTKFVLATTDPEDLLPTIVSRCQRFDFRRISLPAMTARLRTVADAEGIRVDDEALTAIARAATGSLRDALGLLDQLAVYQEDAEGEDAATRVIHADAVRTLLGISRNERVETLVEALANRDVGLALGTVNGAIEAGEDPRQLNRQLVSYLRVLMHERAGGSPDADERAKELAGRFALLELAELAERFSENDARIRGAAFPQLPLEVALVEGVMRRGSEEAAGNPQAAASPEPAQRPRQRAAAPARDERPAAAPSGPSLKDRIRDPAIRLPEQRVDAAPAVDRAAAPELGETQAAPTLVSTVEGADDVERLVNLWPRIRQDVKAVNRRIEALLAEVDPIRVRQNTVVLQAAYAFHKNKLESNEAREVVEAAISRRLGRSVRIHPVLRGEDDDEEAGSASDGAGLRFVTAHDAPYQSSPRRNGRSAPASARSDSAAAESPAEGPETSVGDEADEERQRAEDERLLIAARNIFDAEVIDDPEE